MLTDKELEEKAEEYSGVSFIKALSYFQVTREGANAEIKYKSFLAGYDLAKPEIEKLEQELLTSHKQIEKLNEQIAWLENGVKYFALSHTNSSGDKLHAYIILQKLQEMRDKK